MTFSDCRVERSDITVFNNTLLRITSSLFPFSTTYFFTFLSEEYEKTYLANQPANNPHISIKNPRKKLLATRFKLKFYGK